MSSIKVMSSIGTVEGINSKETLVCQMAFMMNAQGCIWFKGNPFFYTFPTLIFQIVTIFAITSAIWLLLRPLKQGLINAQLIGGILLGPSLLGLINGFSQKLFPPERRMILETIANFGFMFHLFILGVHVNVSLVRKVKRNDIVIGLASYCLPLIAAFLIYLAVLTSTEVDSEIKRTIFVVANLNSETSFPVITSLLFDLKILNSNIGRIATSATLVCDILSSSIGFVFAAVTIGQINGSIWTSFLFTLTDVGFLLIILFGFRPIIVSIARRVPEGGHLNEGQFTLIIAITLVCGLTAQYLGNPPEISMFVLGLVTPDGPSMGSSLVSKIDLLNVGLFLPIKLVLSGLEVDVFPIRGSSGAIIGLVIFVSYMAKFLGAFLPAIYYGNCLKDAAALALIMCCRGVIEVVLYHIVHQKKMINDEEFALLTISMLLVTGIARPLITYLYDPSAKYSTTHRKAITTINHPNEELRILVCVHNEGNVSPVMNLLYISNPTKKRPMRVMVLNLMELKGRAASVLESTHQTRKLTSKRSWPKHVANAFNKFAHQNNGGISFSCLTCISPYSSMHDDICTQALEQGTNMVIVPFHKQQTINGESEGTNLTIRMVNQNVLRKCPCSVGVLIDRDQKARSHFNLKNQNSTFHVYVLFIGGNDDCEALAYSSRFIDNPQVTLTLVWIRPPDTEASMEEDRMDVKMVEQFKDRAIGSNRVIYKEELVSDAIKTTKVLRSMEGICDLCIVGRHHDPNSKLLSGLMDWSEYPELGIIGDMLVTSNFTFSILVIQKQPPKYGLGDLQPVASSKIRSGDHLSLIHSFQS